MPPHCDALWTCKRSIQCLFVSQLLTADLPTPSRPLLASCRRALHCTQSLRPTESGLACACPHHHFFLVFHSSTPLRGFNPSCKSTRAHDARMYTHDTRTIHACTRTTHAHTRTHDACTLRHNRTKPCARHSHTH